MELTRYEHLQATARARNAESAGGPTAKEFDDIRKDVQDNFNDTLQMQQDLNQAAKSPADKARSEVERLHMLESNNPEARRLAQELLSRAEASER